MQLDRLHQLLDELDGAIMVKGPCHDCEQDMVFTAVAKPAGIEIKGGALYEPGEPKQFFIKCPVCYEKNAQLESYQDCEVYSRVVGYLRPVSQWNEAKQQEFHDRTLFDDSAMVTEL